jgi:hypothetical protein
MAKRTPAQIRKALSRPIADDLTDAQAAKRKKKAKAGRRLAKDFKASKVKKKGRKATDVTDIPTLTRKRKRQFEAVFE